MQQSIFDILMPSYKIDKKIRLIELFSGVGAQAMALRDLGLNFEHYKTCEWETHAIASYKAIHMHDDNDYSFDLSKNQLVDTLFNIGISSDGKKPMTKESIARKPEKWLRQTYNNIKSTHDLVDITKVQASDLEITDKDKYCYLMTYSFPCQDLSKAGKQLGMAKGSGTRSSMLWEVERILGGLWQRNQLPQILLMENVPDVIGNKNISDFNKWYAKLETIGYQSYYKVLNAKDYGIPQNRERCFMVSILGDYNYIWPKKQILELRLKDILESNVSEKYYISDDAIKSMRTTSFISRKFENKEPKCIIVGRTDFGNNEALNRIYSDEGISPALDTMQGGNREPKIMTSNDIANTVRTSGRGSLDRHSWDLVLDEPVICASRGRNPEKPTSRKSGEPTKQMIEINTSGCSNTLTTVQKDNYAIVPDATQGVVITDLYNQKTEVKETVGTITANTGTVGHCGNFLIHEQLRVRILTPLECWRLMGFTGDDFYKAADVNSNSQLYKQAGNSIVKHVLMAIIGQMI